MRPLQSDAAHEATRRAVEAFLDESIHDSGVSLQDELVERDRQNAVLAEPTSYVRPFWNDMYLRGRYPLPINSNPAIGIAPPLDASTKTQQRCAADLTCRFAQFKDQKNKGPANCYTKIKQNTGKTVAENMVP